MQTALAICSLITFLLPGCGYFPRKVSMDDPEVQQFLKAAASFDRTSYGFSPIPHNADVRLETRPTDEYDAMLHITSKGDVRTIAFRKVKGNFIWIGEQEMFQGPKTFDGADGTENEAITLTYETQKVSGFPLNQLNVTYSGEDPRLAFPKKPGLAEVKPVLKEWGY